MRQFIDRASMNYWTVILLCLLTCACSEKGQSKPANKTAVELVHQARSAYAEENYIKALDLALRAAELGNATAMNDVGFSYYNGKGVLKNPKVAFEWWEKAANLGNADAMSNLGLIYIHRHQNI